MTENTSRLRRAFILGAGASISHAGGQFPGISDFFKFAKELGVVDKTNSLGIDELSSYIERKYARSIFNKRHIIDIEKVLTLLEIDIGNGERPEYLPLRESILRLVVEVIQKQQENISINTGDYDLFVTQLRFDDQIITFNWDTLLDSCLSRFSQEAAMPGNTQWNALVRRFIYNDERTLGIPLARTSARHPIFEDPQSAESAWEPSYLKMHGSVDWVSCQNELCPAKGYLFRIVNPRESHRCGHCFELTQIVIIPPVLNKSVSKIAAIRRIWNYANRSIRTAEEVVIWGYSLPPTDFYAENLLRMARKKELGKIDIINPLVVYKMHGGFRRNRRFIERFEDVFGIKHKNGLNVFESFTDWRANMPADIKYGF